ncbi:hypothetical protein QR680_007140 [Steinernema hermaphroditum]|uniref:Uncharacterized protein n=1 Tax=Steinernema hermaphroditum TaxID=289476 RepID=A0AA39HXR1_9BILA|nr:hypothetical protein QR680_007140 [Steinernema hermaphroditum]
MVAGLSQYKTNISFPLKEDQCLIESVFFAAVGALDVDVAATLRKLSEWNYGSRVLCDFCKLKRSLKG